MIAVDFDTSSSASNLFSLPDKGLAANASTFDDRMPIYTQTRKYALDCLSRSGENNFPYVYESRLADITSDGAAADLKLQKEINLVNALRQYHNLKEGWDGYEGIAPAQIVVNSVISFVKLLSEQGFASPKPMASGSGEVGLYWDENGYFVDIGFDSPHHYTYFTKGKNFGSFGEDDVPFDTIPERLVKVLRAVTRERDISKTAV